MVFYQEGSLGSQQPLLVNGFDDGLVEWTVVGGVKVDQIEASAKGGQGAQRRENRSLQDECLFPNPALSEILPNYGSRPGGLFDEDRFGGSTRERLNGNRPRPGAKVRHPCSFDLCRHNIEDRLPEPIRRWSNRHPGQGFQSSTFVEARNDSHG